MVVGPGHHSSIIPAARHVLVIDLFHKVIPLLHTVVVSDLTERDIHGSEDSANANGLRTGLLCDLCGHVIDLRDQLSACRDLACANHHIHDAFPLHQNWFTDAGQIGADLGAGSQCEVSACCGVNGARGIEDSGFSHRDILIGREACRDYAGAQQLAVRPARGNARLHPQLAAGLQQACHIDVLHGIDNQQGPVGSVARDVYAVAQQMCALTSDDDA